MMRTNCFLILGLALIPHAISTQAFANSYDGTCLDAPPLAAPENVSVVEVSTEAALQQAMNNLSDNTLIEIAPGEYRLSNTLWVNNRDNVTIRGNSTRCDEVVLIGKGMENASGVSEVPHGIWTNSANLRVENLTIRDVYYHAIAIDGQAETPNIYNVRMLDTGEQFVKSSSQGFGNGADNGRVEYSIMKYLSGPPTTDHGGGTGYTNGVDVHGGKNWVIANNRFENFHAPDNSDNLWNPAVLMWNGAGNTTVENNIFLDVDRAIAFGLLDRSYDHQDGIIVNNMITMSNGLYSQSRMQESDAAIIVWSSPGTQVLHNTIMTQGNTNKAVELRFDSSGVVVQNNLISGPVSDRSGNSFLASGNVITEDTGIFVDIQSGNLHLKQAVEGISNSAEWLTDAPVDFDGDSRSSGQMSDVGADEMRSGGGECRAIL